jgi:hypothetical protein
MKYHYDDTAVAGLHCRILNSWTIHGQDHSACINKSLGGSEGFQSHPTVKYGHESRGTQNQESIAARTSISLTVSSPVQIWP